MLITPESPKHTLTHGHTIVFELWCRLIPLPQYAFLSYSYFIPFIPIIFSPSSHSSRCTMCTCTILCAIPFFLLFMLFLLYMCCVKMACLMDMSVRELISESAGFLIRVPRCFLCLVVNFLNLVVLRGKRGGRERKEKSGYFPNKIVTVRCESCYSFTGSPVVNKQRKSLSRKIFSLFHMSRKGWSVSVCGEQTFETEFIIPDLNDSHECVTSASSICQQ